MATEQSKIPFGFCQCGCGKRTKIAPRTTTRAGHKKGRPYLFIRGHQNQRPSTRTHGHSTGGRVTETYEAWRSMKSRCLNKANKSWPRYGGRGIRVCDRWTVFDNFLNDMGTKPANRTLERIDNDGHYEPSNCCWASRKQQNNNTSRNRYITAFGETKTMQTWATEFGIPRTMLMKRLNRGWSPERALTTARMLNQFQ